MVSWNSEQEKELIKEEIREKIRKRFENISTKDLIMLSEFIYFYRFKIPIDTALKNLSSDTILISILSDMKYSLELKSCGNSSYDLEDLKVVRHLLNRFPVKTALNIIEESISLSMPLNNRLQFKTNRRR